MATVRRGRLQQEAAQQYLDGYAYNPEYGAQHTHKVVNPLQLIDTVDVVIPSNTVSDILAGRSSAGGSQQQPQHVADTNAKATAHFYIPHLHASSDSSDALGPSASTSSIVNPAHPLNRRAPPPPPQCTTTTEEITAAISATDLSGFVTRGAGGEGPETAVPISDVLAGTAMRKTSVKTVSTTTAAAYIHPLPYTPLPAEARDALWVKGVLSHRSSHAFDKWLAAEAYIEEEDSIREAEEKEREMEARRNRRKQQQRGLLFLDFAGSPEHPYPHKGGRPPMDAAEVGSTSAWSDFESHSVVTEGGPVGSGGGGIGHYPPSFGEMRRGGGGVGSSATATTAASLMGGGGGRTRGGGGGGTGTASVSSFGGGRPLRAIDVRSQVKSRTKRAREEEGSLLTTSALLSLAAETNNTNSASGQTNVPNSLFEWQRQEPLLPLPSSSSSPPLRPFPAPDPLPMMMPCVSSSSSSLTAAAAAAATTTVTGGLSRRELKNRTKELAHQQHLLIAQQHAALRNRSTSGDRRSASMASSSCAANVTTVVGSGISVLPTNTSATVIKKEDGVVGAEATTIIDTVTSQIVEGAEDESDKVSSVGAFAGSDVDEAEVEDADGDAEEREHDILASSGHSRSAHSTSGGGVMTGAEQQIKHQSNLTKEAKAKASLTNVTANRSSNSTPIAIINKTNNKNNSDNPTTDISAQQKVEFASVAAGKSLSPHQGFDSALHLPPPPTLPTTSCEDENTLYPYPPQYTIEYGPASVACGLYEKGKARRRAEVVLDRRTPSCAHHSGGHFFGPPPPLPLPTPTRSSVHTPPNDNVPLLGTDDSTCRNATVTTEGRLTSEDEALTHHHQEQQHASSANIHSAVTSASVAASIVSLAENSSSALLLRSLPPPPNPNTLTQLMYLEKALAMYRLVLNEANGILMGCGQFKERAALLSNIDTALSPQLTSHIAYLTQAVRVTEGEISKLENTSDDVKAGGTDTGGRKKKDDASRGLSPSSSSNMFMNGGSGGGDVGVDGDEDDYDGNAARIRAVRLTCDVLKRQLDKLKGERDSAMAAVASFALNAKGGSGSSRGSATAWGSSLLMSGGLHLTSSSSSLDAASTSLEGEGIGLMSLEGVPLPPSGPSTVSGGQSASNTTNSSSRVRTRPKNANNPTSSANSIVPVAIPSSTSAAVGDDESVATAALLPIPTITGVANNTIMGNNNSSDTNGTLSSFAASSFCVPEGDKSNADGGVAPNEGSSPPSTLAFPLPLPTLFLRPAPVDAIIAEDEATRLVRLAFSSAKGGLRREVADPFNLLQDKTRKAREALRKSYTAQQTAARLVIAKNVATVVEKVLSSSSFPINKNREKKGLAVEGSNEGNEGGDEDENDIVDNDDGAEGLSRTLGEDAVVDDEEEEEDNARQTASSANKKVSKSSRHQSKLKRRGAAAGVASSARRTPATTMKRTAQPLKKDSVLSRDLAPKEVGVSTRSTRRRAVDVLENAANSTNNNDAQNDANPTARARGRSSAADQHNNKNTITTTGGDGRRLVGALLRREREKAMVRQATGRSTTTARQSARSPEEGQREEEALPLSTRVTTRRTRRRANENEEEEGGADGL